MELNDYKFPPISSSNTGSMAVLNNPLESKPISNPLEKSSKKSSKEISYKQISNPLSTTTPIQNQNQAFHQTNYMNNPLSSNFNRTNTYLPQSSFLLNNPLMSKDPLQSNLYMNNNNLQNTQTNMNLNMVNMNTNLNNNMLNMNNMNVFNQNMNVKQNVKPKQNLKNYTVKVDNEKYNLTIECNNIYFYFKLVPANSIILAYYKGEFNLSTIINKMNVVINNHNAFEQLNKIVEKAINDDTIKIIHDKLKKKMIIRFNKNNNDYSSDFELEEISNNKKLFNNIFEELNLLKFQQIQYMTLFKNNNFISNKDVINLINENNSKNDFENKIKNIDSICNTQKNEIINLKNEITNTKNDFENKIKNVNNNEIKNEVNNTKNGKENNFDFSELKNEITNIKNDFVDKIKNINLNEIKDEITNLKNNFEDKIKNINSSETNNIKNDSGTEHKNIDFNEIKNNINGIKEDFENRLKTMNFEEIKKQVSGIKEDFESKIKNINFDEIKNEINNNKEDFENKIKNINLDEIKNEINNVKSDFENKIKDINLEEVKQNINNIKTDFEDKFKNINIDALKNEIATLKNNLENKINNLNLDEIKNEISNTKNDLETKITNINITEIKNDITNLKNDLDTKIKNIDFTELKQNITNIQTELNNKIKNINLEELKQEINNVKSDLENKIQNSNTSMNENNNEFNEIKNEITNLKQNVTQIIETQTNSNKESNDLKQEILKIKEEQVNKENELKNEIEILKEENQKLKIENETIKQQIEKQNIENENNNKIFEENNQNLKTENNMKLFEEISSLKQINSQMKEDKIKLEKEITQLKEQLSLIIEKENKKEEKIRLANENIKKKTKEQINHKFIEKPEKLKNKFDILNTNNIFFIDEFAVYTSITDNKEYLASGNKNNYNIDIYDIRNNIFYVSLKAHNNGTPTVRYFLDEKKNKEYLISADFLKTVIIWDINNEYNILLKISNKDYKGSILSAILFFNVKIKDNEYNDFIITSSDDENDDFSKIYSFNNGSFVRNISNTNKNNSYYLLPWVYNNNYYIIDLCLNKIFISNLLTDEKYGELVSAPESSHFGGFVYNSNYLCCSSENGQIRIWDLVKKNLVKKIEMKGSCYFEIIPWNEQYVIAANYKNNSFDIFDIEKGELFKQITTSHSAGVRAVKKIFLPNYGECLFTSGHDNVIKMWSL